MKNHAELIKELLERPAVRTEVERIEREEEHLFHALLSARQEAGLSQAKVRSHHQIIEQTK